MNLYKITQAEARPYTGRKGDKFYAKEGYVLARSIEEAVIIYKGKFPDWSITNVEVLACGQGDVGVVVLIADTQTPANDSKIKRI